jgi:ferredoxin--NADP+ reductase
LYKVLETTQLASDIYQFKINAPLVARKARAGQFVMLRLHQNGERIPLTIADWDANQGSITIVFMAVGATTCQLSRLKKGGVISTS